MAITEEQRIRRKDHLGSSDVSALLGLNPFKAEHDVFIEKTFDLKPGKTGDAAECGNILEPYICRWLADKEGINHEETVCDPDKLYKEYPANTVLACNLDTDIPARKTGIEAKFTTMWDEWGHEGDAVPERVYCQTQHQMLCTGYQFMHVAVWIAPMKFDRAAFIAAFNAASPLPLEYTNILAACFDCRPFHIDRDDAFIDKIIRITEAWWPRYVIPAREGREYPDDISRKVASLDTVRRIKTTPGKIAQVKSTLYSDWDYADMQYKKADAARKEARAKLIAARGDASRIQLEDGRAFDWKNNRLYEVKEEA